MISTDMVYTAYFDTNGKMLYVIDRDAELYENENAAAIVKRPHKINPNLFYYDFDHGVMLHKQEFVLTVDGNAINGIPEGTIVHVNGVDSIVIDDGEFYLDVDYDATLEVTFEHTRYLTKTMEVFYAAETE